MPDSISVFIGRHVVRHGGIHLCSIEPFGRLQSADRAPNRYIDRAVADEHFGADNALLEQELQRD
ncbi:hypothetical protein [Bradyrhizobium ivorense]|uniref:hypothetical protein n=1 Tax=Bradyrhizobium ivorense TaxID=2511166 RepID=UPI001117560E|nr:hypothetical protein [Bradyrhizobium ivorense]